ncbi:Mediator of RNA polymerase II transcription subunit 18 [Debaryomyces fabryi]|uniref:Mediator of RNA polymerase II transcription subunit 18 n=1 Tax=Debaryomyces fabryi TaxID=58627 RepID=A0A0V1PVX2_9ASCO|nr:Mediator of RNA polymerase II transcription subunit 18 [Debaryomyces fabryi]KSA00336.1 Mediator of RNA polymerase II transcription subunit 18 [Debaryomyces fabryi]CUM49303.1 unnamed protein product [Debaryomyces fabryi]
MVHQLSLVSTVSHSNYVQTISTLQALTGLLTPQLISTYTLVTKPHDVFKPKFEPGKVNQIEQFYMRCITTWNDKTGIELDLSSPLIENETEILVDRLFLGVDDRRNWTMQISDIPIAGKNQACSAQTIYESTLVHHHTKVMDKEKIQLDVSNESNMEIDDKDEDKKDNVKKEDIGTEIGKNNEEVRESDEKPKEDGEVKKNDAPIVQELEVLNRRDSFLQFLEDLGYDVINQFWMKGVRFFHGDVVIEIFKIFVRDDEKDAAKDKIRLKLLDPSNTFQIRTYINVPKSTDVELINQGTKDLLKLQDFLKNLIKLEIPDRMFMDSRVTYK